MTRLGHVLLCALALAFAACGDDDYGVERPAHDAGVTSDGATDAGDLAPAADLADGGG